MQVYLHWRSPALQTDIVDRLAFPVPTSMESMSLAIVCVPVETKEQMTWRNRASCNCLARASSSAIWFCQSKVNLLIMKNIRNLIRTPDLPEVYRPRVRKSADGRGNASSSCRTGCIRDLPGAGAAVGAGPWTWDSGVASPQKESNTCIQFNPITYLIRVITNASARCIKPTNGIQLWLYLYSALHVPILLPQDIPDCLLIHDRKHTVQSFLCFIERYRHMTRVRIRLSIRWCLDFSSD